MAQAVVIGGGVAGLATAILLAKRGDQVTLVEQTDRLGGRVDQQEIAGFVFDCGPSWFLMPECFEHFFELAGTSLEQELQLVELAPAYRIFQQDQTGRVLDKVDVTTGIAKVTALFDRYDPGSGKRVAKYLATASKVYRLSLDWFLYTTYQSFVPFLRPQLLKHGMLFFQLLGQSLQTYANKVTTQPLLRQILQYPAVFLATDPSKTPALYSLLSHTDLVAGVKYPLGGFRALITAMEKLAVKLGVKILLNTKATEVTTGPVRPQPGAKRLHHPQAAVTGVLCRTPTGTTELLPADVVVSNADLAVSEQLLPEQLRQVSTRKWHKLDPGLSAIVVLLGVADPLPELLHHQLLLQEDWAEDFAAVFGRRDGWSQSVYVCKNSATDPAAAPENQSNLFVLIPCAASESFGHGDLYGHLESEQVAKIAAAVIEQLQQVVGRRLELVVKKTIGPADFADRYGSWHASAIGYAHPLQQSAWLRQGSIHRKVQGLFYAGGTVAPGVGLPMCLISAENVVKAIAGDTSVLPLQELPPA